jgi:hypothetical protein
MGEAQREQGIGKTLRPPQRNTASEKKVQIPEHYLAIAVGGGSGNVDQHHG